MAAVCRETTWQFMWTKKMLARPLTVASWYTTGPVDSACGQPCGALSWSTRRIEADAPNTLSLAVEWAPDYPSSPLLTEAPPCREAL